LPPETLEALSEIALRLSAAAVVFQILFLPSNGGTAVEGTVPNAPGLAYRYDPDTGVLRLSQGGGDGTVTALGEFHVGLDGRFYDASGNAVGRPLPDGGVVVDTTALPGYRSSSAADAEARAGSVAVTDTNEPKLCPRTQVWKALSAAPKGHSLTRSRSPVCHAVSKSC